METILFLDTTTSVFVLELFTGDGTQFNLLYRFAELAPRESASLLFPKLQELRETTKMEKPTRILVSSGPGSFMGIRIGLSTAKTLAQVWEIPILAVDSLFLIHCHHSKMVIDEKIVVALDGKMGKYYSNNGSDSKDLTKEELLVTYSHHKLITDSPELIQFYSESKNTPNTSLQWIESGRLHSSETFIRNHWEIIHGLNLDKNSFSTVRPNYLRGTYADHKQKPNHEPQEKA